MNNDFKIYLKALIDDSSLSNVEKKLAKERLKISADIDLKDFAKNKADIEKQFQSLAGIIKNILGDAVSDRQATQWAKQYYKEIERGVNDLSKAQQRNINSIDFEIKKREEQAKVFSNSIKSQMEAAQKLAEQQQRITEKSNKIQLSIDTEKYSTQIFSLQEQLKKFGSKGGEVFINAQNSLKALGIAYENMKSSSGDERIEYEKEYQKHLETTRNLLKQVSSQKGNELIPQTDSRRLNFIKQLNDYLSKNTAMTKRSQNEIKSWIATLSSVDDMTRSDLENLKASFQNLDTQLRNTGKLGLSWADKFKQAISKFGGWAVATGSVMELWSWVRRIPQEVIKVDSAMTELYKVSDASALQIKSYFNEAAESAKRYGASITDVINATADWSRLGYSLPDSKELAEIAVLYKNVGDGISIDTASKSLVSTLQGFQLEAKDALNIIDQFNEVANNFPIDSAGIGEALQRSAASFYAANTDLSKSIALITGTNSVVQDPTSVGTMWKTVSMRIRGAKTELEEAGEDTEGMVESTAELRDLIKGMTGFDIMKDEDTFKDIYDIVVGIGHEWKNLTDIQRSSLLEKLSGKRQGNALSAALNNINMIEDAYNTATNAAGSAMEEQEKYEQSIQYSLDRLNASFQELSNTVLDSDFLKVLADGTTSVVNSLDSIIDRFGLLTPLLAGGGIAAFIKNFDWPCNKGYCLDF